MVKPTALREGSRRNASGCEYIDLFCKEVCFTFDENGFCVDISENWPSVSGYNVHDCLHESLFSFIRKVDQKKIYQLIESPALVKKPRFRLRHQAGHWEWFEITAVKRTDEGLIRMAAAKISDEVAKEHELQKASLEAELAMRGQSEFFAHISHELRTPLNAILGFSQMMHQGMFGEIENPRYRDYIRLLEQSGQDLLGKINDLLEISSLCAGIDKVSEQNIPLKDLVRNVVDSHSRELFSRHLQVNVQLVNASVVGDRIKLHQALSHLLKNAMKFSPAETSIRFSAELNENEDLEITLVDEGPGFTAEHLHYFREHPKNFTFLERNRRLMGFGLPLADELIRLHGGRIQCRNSEETGAEIVITLPAKRVIAVKKDAERKTYSRRETHEPIAAVAAAESYAF